MAPNAKIAETKLDHGSPSDTFEVIMETSERCGELPDLDEGNPDDILGYDEHGAPG